MADGAQQGKAMTGIETLAGKRLLFVMAAEPEYGPHLRARFTPLITGVGPVEAAMRVAWALAESAGRGQAPDMVVSLGSAGSARLEQGAVYQAHSVSYRDMDATALGFARGQTPFLDLPPVLPLPVQVPGIASASLSTGANIVSGRAYEGIEADMVDMETFAVLRACQQAGLPLIALRGISDGASELSKLADWTEYLHIVDERLAGAVDRVADALGDGTLL